MKKENKNNYKFLNSTPVVCKKFMINKLKKFFQFQFQHQIQQNLMNKNVIFKKLIQFIYKKFLKIQGQLMMKQNFS